MRVSVVIPVFNAAQYLEQAVASVVAELPRHEIEIVLVEDGSQDDSWTVCLSLARRYGCVRLLRHPGGVNRGPGASRNLGIESADGDAVAFLDADDYWMPNRLDRALGILEEAPEIDGVYEAVAPQFDEGATEADRLRLRGLRAPRSGLRPDEVFDAICLGPCWHTNGIVLRRSIFRRSGLFDPRLLLGQDRHLWLRVAAVGRLAEGVCDAPVAVHRRHGGNRWKTEIEPDRFQVLRAVSDWMDRAVGPCVERKALRRALLRTIEVQPPRPWARQVGLRLARTAWIAKTHPAVLAYPSFYRLLTCLFLPATPWWRVDGHPRPPHGS